MTPPARSADERKLVTVVFCDLVGSTALSGRLDPEALRMVTLRYFDLMRDQIEEHGGTVEKFIGDAVMAVFGVPTVREDDARRALAAALGMVDALDGLNAHLDTELGVRLDVRIGVNTGQVMATSDATARQALISGETVNVAARLEQNAGPGEILIGPDTLLAAGPGVTTEPTGPLLLKGKAEPFPAHRLLALGDDDPAALRRFDLPFVGRRRELGRLDALLSEVTVRRRAALRTLHGEAGIGKSRLLREWLDGSDRRAAVPVLHGTGRCQTFGARGSLGPLADAVRALLAAAAPGTPADTPLAELTGLDQAYDILTAGLLRDGTPSPSAADTCAALAALLGRLARRRPVVLVVDDCQWAPAALTDLLAELTGRLAHAPVLVLCLARPEPVPAAEQPWLLPGLTTAEAAELAGHLAAEQHTGPGTPDPAVLDRALERAGGNPLHLEQLLAGGPEPADADAELPPGLQAVLGARIDALAPAERLLLDLASVLGDEFRAADLADLAGVGDAEVRAGLLRLSGRRLVQPAPVGGTYRFTSRLVQEVAYACMAKRTRAEWHERAARLASVRRAGPSALGAHLERAHRYRAELGAHDAHTAALRGEALTHLSAAGAEALARADLAWAEDLLTRAVALEPCDPAAKSAAANANASTAAPANASTAAPANANANTPAPGTPAAPTPTPASPATPAPGGADASSASPAAPAAAGTHPAPAPASAAGPGPRAGDSAPAAPQPTPAPEPRHEPAPPPPADDPATPRPHTHPAAHPAPAPDAPAASDAPDAELAVLAHAAPAAYAPPAGPDPYAATPSATALRARRRLGEVRLALGRADEGRALLRDAMARATDPVEAAHARLTLAAHDGTADAARTAREVLPVFEAGGDELGQARAGLRIAQAHQLEGRHADAERLLIRTLAHAVRADAEPERAAALGAVGVSLWRGPAPAAEAIARCRALLEEHGPGRRAVRVTLNCPLAVLLALHGRPVEAAGRLAEAGGLAAELGFAEARIFLPLFTAMVDALADRPADALARLAEAREAGTELGAEPLLAPVALESARQSLALDDPAAAASHLAYAAASAESLPGADRADLAGLRARVAAYEGRAAEAARLAAYAVREASATDSPLVRAQAALDRAWTARALGDTAGAAGAAREARAAFAAKGHRPGVRWADALLGNVPATVPPPDH